jgi:hypothetical protein
VWKSVDGGSLNGGGEELAIVGGLAGLRVGKSLDHLTINVEEDGITPPFEPLPLHICNQEERTTNSEAIGIGEIVEERV